MTIMLSSATYAAKAKKILGKVGIDAKIIKSDNIDGCTYGINITRDHFYTAIDELKNAGINYKVI